MALTRLNKIIADAGIASRRAADQLILDGRVSVDGETVIELGSRTRDILSIALKASSSR